MKTPTQHRQDLDNIRAEVLDSIRAKLETLPRVQGLKAHPLKKGVLHESGRYDADANYFITGIWYNLEYMDVDMEGDDVLVSIKEATTNQLIEILDNL